VGNAVKFTEQGFILVSVSRQSSTFHPNQGGLGFGGKAFYRFIIRDTGVGIPSRMLPQLFDPFTQGHTSQKKADGSGLGLSLVKMFAEALGGSVRVTSEEHRGSIFTVEIPFTPLPPGTISESIDRLQVHSDLLSVAKLGILYSSRATLNSLVFHLSSWQVPYRIIGSVETPSGLTNFLAQARSHRVASEEDAEGLPPICLLIDGDVSTLLRAVEDVNCARQTSGEGAALEVRILFMCSLSSYSLVVKEVQANNLSAWVSVLTKPLSPLKLNKSFARLIRASPTSRSTSFTTPSLPFTAAFQIGSFNRRVASKLVTLGEQLKEGGEEEEELGRALPPRLNAPACKGIPAPNGANGLTFRPHLSNPQGLDQRTLGGERLQVLVVEDNKVNQMVLSRQMEKLGVHFKVTPSGTDAVRIWEETEGSISVIFMDVEVEGDINGLQATLEIRARERAKGGRQRTFIAMMTGRALEEDKREALAAGCDDFLIKPVSLEVIRALVTLKLRL